MEELVYFKKTEHRKEFVLWSLKKLFTAPEGVKVLVKPNVVSAEIYPSTTHPEVLETVLEFLIQKKYDLKVGDGPAFEAGNADDIIQNHPLNQVCQKYGLKLINFLGDKFEKINTGQGLELLISSFALQSDYLISLPVLKPHTWTDLTGALKNQFGLFPSQERIAMHYKKKDIHKSIAVCNVIIKPDLFVVDAIQTYRHANEKRHGSGEPVYLGYMYAGKNPVALDCFGLELLKSVAPGLQNKKTTDIAHLEYAVQFGVGTKSYQAVEVKNEEI
jgi:uncharacterized protein (DUF362 family)